MIKIPGQPKGKARPRITKNGTFTPKETKQYQDLVANMYRLQKGPYLGCKTIKVVLHCYYKIPKSMPKYKREMVKRGSLRPIVKPDLDNVAKCVLDALNGVAYKDDNQIVELHIEKYYSDEPRVEIEVTEVEEPFEIDPRD